MRSAHKTDDMTQSARVSIFRRIIARALPVTVHSQQQVTQCQKRLVNAGKLHATRENLYAFSTSCDLALGPVPFDSCQYFLHF